MNRVCRTILIVTAMFASAGLLRAQEANPISTNLKGDWTNINGLITKMADKMPAEDYSFQPTPAIQTFGQRMAHIVGFNMRTCAQLKGDQNPLMFSQMPTKDEITAGIKQETAECDAFFNSLTDADVAKMVNMGRGGPRQELSMIQGFILEHSQEVYGYMCVYLRLKDIVPPSSDRNEMPGGRAGGRRGGA